MMFERRCICDLTLGSYSYRFNAEGIYYYWTPVVIRGIEFSMRGIIEVARAENETLTVEGIWNKTQTGKSQCQIILMRKMNFHSANMCLSIFLQCYELHGMYFCKRYSTMVFSHNQL